MMLITGGAFQGKLDYALNIRRVSSEDIIDGETCIFEELLEKPMVKNFHLWIRRMLLQQKDVYALVDLIIKNNPEITIIVNELGCGIVPINTFDREYRETVGRISCKLANKSLEVHRVICGIGMVIKHA